MASTWLSAEGIAAFIASTDVRLIHLGFDIAIFIIMSLLWRLRFPNGMKIPRDAFEAKVMLVIGCAFLIFGAYMAIAGSDTLDSISVLFGAIVLQLVFAWSRKTGMLVYDTVIRGGLRA